MAIDFLESDLRPGKLFELVITLGLDITEIRFREIITQLNLKFLSPRVIFSGSRQGKELKIFYSTDGYGISQREVVFALMTGFENYGPSIQFEKSPGQVPGAVPLVTPKKEPIPLFSPEYVGEFVEDAKEKIKEVAKEVVDEIEKTTGWPRWSIPYILGGSAVTVILLVLWAKSKPILIIKK